MDLKKRLSLEQGLDRNESRGHPWWRWVLLTTLVLLLSAPFFLDFTIVENSPVGHRYYRPAEAWTGERLPDTAAFIYVNSRGYIRVSSGEEMSLPISTSEELDEFVESVVSTFPERPFILKIDNEIPYERVDEILTALKTAGVHEVFFLTVLPEDM
jgi:biopolymer transport protein ExbD